MNRDTRKQALSEFLTKHRAKLQPQELGLPAGGRRRTAGLRREEVAQAANVSTTWYTWLEQGREIKVSPHVLDRIAHALHLNDDERKYLFVLAQEQPFLTPGIADNPPILPGAFRLILDELSYYPAIVSDRHCGIVGWNPAAAAVFLDFATIPPEERNMIWLLFTRKEFKALAANWSDFTRGFLAIFRSYYGQYVGDGWYEDFIRKLSAANPEFQAIWNRNDVSTAPDVSIEFRHAKAGKLLFDLTSLQIQGQFDLRCSVYTPSENSTTESKIKLLLKRSGGH